MPIHILSAELASQIAAGEVVERPASVVKELVENALDAGATQIRIEVVEGGRRLIRVADDGIGIPADEAPLAFERHATSKIASAADLARITTLGFRGEALAAIASVSQVTCITRARDQEIGARLRLEGGRLIEHKSIGAPAGTMITVENLFYNVPARLKFLKAATTERRHIDALVTRYALAYPHVRFHLSHDGRVAFETTGNGALADVLIAVYGLDTARQMIEVEAEDEAKVEVEVKGYVSEPGLTRANRNELTFFVNGRWVQDRSLAFAVIQAYHTMLQVNRYPLCFLRIDLPPEEIDVNVHPTKSEIRFRNSDAVFHVVQKAVRQALIQQSAISHQPSAFSDQPSAIGFQPSAFSPPPSDFRPPTSDLRLPTSDLRPPTSDLRPPTSDLRLPTSDFRLPPLRVVGQINATYIVAEGPEGLYLIDQHAAHERVLYEQFMGALQSSTAVVQNLLDPLPVELTVEAVTLVQEHAETLQRLGFELQEFGGNTFLLRSVPAILAQADLRAALNDVLTELDIGEMPLAGDQEARLVRRICKQAAIKAGQVLSLQEMEGLVRQLENCAAPRTCPHGRPTMIHLSSDQLAREFGRR